MYFPSFSGFVCLSLGFVGLGGACMHMRCALGKRGGEGKERKRLRCGEVRGGEVMLFLEAWRDE